VDRVRARPGGRNAEVRTRVFEAVRDALERGDPTALTIDEIARRSGVHRATIYRRWLSTGGLVADLLIALTPVHTPLPDTGDLRTDLLDVATRVAGTVASPMSRALLPLIAAGTDERLDHAAARYWGSLFEHTATVIRRAQQRGHATADIDPVHAIEMLLAPIYLRSLVTHQPIDDVVLERTVDLIVRTLTGHRSSSSSRKD
jgi:AcrR family transcriptional regulator